MASKPADYLPPNQRRGLHMISKGFKPVHATVQALFDRRLVTGTLREPRLNDAGRYFVNNGELPPG